MKRKFVMAFLAAVFTTLSVASPAVAAEQHPPKFGVSSTQCTGGSNQPNCPDGH